MKKLLLSIALVLSAGNFFGLSALHIPGSYLQNDSAKLQLLQNIKVGGVAPAGAVQAQISNQGPKPTLDANCIPLGYRTTSSLGNTGGFSMSYVPQQISLGNPDYNAYVDCMRKKGLQPAKALWK